MKKKYNFVNSSWMESASEDELRSVCSQMEDDLNKVDWEDDELYDVHNDLVNTISSRFPLNLPHREHGWYLPNDDD